MANNMLGKWLKEKCQEEHLSLREAGKKAGISHTTVEAIIKGGHATAETVIKLAHAFGGDDNEGIALEDKLLILAGYRTERPEEVLNEPLAKLLGIAQDFSEPKLKVLKEFAVYLASVITPQD